MPRGAGCPAGTDRAKRTTREGSTTLGVIEELKHRAAGRNATIVYPEPEDRRIVEAAGHVAEQSIAEPLLVGHERDLPRDPAVGLRAESVEGSERLRHLADEYARRRDVGERVARRLVGKPLIYSAMMVALGHADGMVAGASHATSSVLQAAALAIGYREGIAAPSSYFIMVVPTLGGRRDVPLIFADCAANVDPTSEQLAAIALTAAESARRLLDMTPRVAMLSFSTYGSSRHPKVGLVRRAAELAAERIQDGFVEGELQLDAAVAPEVAARKVEQKGNVAGRANVLVFPDLNAGNIAYKAVQYLGGARAIGPILQGFAKPVSGLSRGASVDDIVAITAVTVLQV